MELPNKYNFLEVEKKWITHWQNIHLYQYNKNVGRENTFVVDTPPPTVSGSLHMGHVFSYTQTDIIVRFQRMQGKNIFYPIGWDNNGLATERRIENLFGIKCDPAIHYDAQFQLEEKGDKKWRFISRKNFVEVCRSQTKTDQLKYKALWQTLALSFDWDEEYSSIDEFSIKVSQRSFLDLVAKQCVESRYAPTMWDVTFKTAVALAEVEDKEEDGYYYHLEFTTQDQTSFVIATTRPELLPACVAIAVNPDDPRYQHLIDQEAITPLFSALVPIIADPHVSLDKGTGVMMICTFGDGADVELWKRHRLPLKQIINKEGRLASITFGEGPFLSRNPEVANQFYSELFGLTIKKAKAKIVEMLAMEGTSLTNKTSALIKTSDKIRHAVKYYEKGDLPLEYLPTRQWFIRITDQKTQLLKQGEKIHWHPPHMLTRYQQWVEGLNQEWCISRQRFFGVPFPVWYPVLDDGRVDYDKPIFAELAQLPVDPAIMPPPGFSEEQRGMPKGFVADPDVMDTWATSSLTPFLANRWEYDRTRYQNLYPADLRPQAHEIIRTWAFYTITKAWLHEKQIPWHNIAISGWVVNPDKSKMSKSKGNVVTPESLLDKYSADALRYWAARAKLGGDTVFDESVFMIGQKLVNKLVNAAKFALLQLPNADQVLLHETIIHPLDQAWLRQLDGLIIEVSAQFAQYDYAKALANIESLFWFYCDYIIELVKVRAYQKKETAEGLSAIASLIYSTQIFLKLLAPILPFVTEEIWSWLPEGYKNHEKSIHVATWPKALLGGDHAESQILFEEIKLVLDQCRQVKTQAQKSMKQPILRCEIKANVKTLDRLRPVLDDVALAICAPLSDVFLTVDPNLGLEINVFL